MGFAGVGDYMCRRFNAALALAVGAVLWAGATSRASVVDTASNSAATRLVNTQQLNGSWTGDPNFADYQGPIVSGLVQAYTASGNASYKTAAENGANYIISNSSPNYLGDEAMALMAVSSIQPTPNANAYRTAATVYYNVTIGGAPGGTNSYCNNLVAQYTSAFNEQSQATIYLAYHTLAADECNATDKSIWRQKLIATLGDVDDADYFPVGALGISVWALAQTGNGLSNATTITGSSSVLNGMNLSQLPGLLANQMVSAGPNTNDFYYDFGHTGAGYTEDGAFALLGLNAADATVGGYSGMVLNGRTALTSAVDNNGVTYVDVGQNAPAYNVYAGRFLSAVPEPSSAALILCGLAGITARRRRQRQA
jgi:hypothetical protein